LPKFILLCTNSLNTCTRFLDLRTPASANLIAAIMAVNTRLHNAPIVLDNGSGTIRAGFAGEDLPKCYFPSYVGRPKHVRAMAGAREGDVFIGPMAQDLRGLLKINYPLEHGIVTDWDDMERIWQYVYQEGLKTLSEDVGGTAFNLPYDS
jgi:actin-related protein